MRAADPSALYVLAFCRGISDGTPTSIPLEPLDGRPINECFSIVPDYMAAHGGNEVFGWAIWEWPRVFIEAEFHCVWRSSTGPLIDITPKPKRMENMTFLPDPARTYRGRQVNNIRRPMSDSLTIRRYIETHNKLFEAMNRGSLADYHGPVEATSEMIKLQDRAAALYGRLVQKYGVP